jgi:hypothetical protein
MGYKYGRNINCPYFARGIEMFGKKEAKPFPKIDPVAPTLSHGRTIMSMNADGLVSISETANFIGKLVLWFSDADGDLEIYTPISAAS